MQDANGSPAPTNQTFTPTTLATRLGYGDHTSIRHIWKNVLKLPEQYGQNAALTHEQLLAIVQACAARRAEARELLAELQGDVPSGIRVNFPEEKGKGREGNGGNSSEEKGKGREGNGGNSLEEKGKGGEGNGGNSSEEKGKGGEGNGGNSSEEKGKRLPVAAAQKAPATWPAIVALGATVAVLLIASVESVSTVLGFLFPKSEQGWLVALAVCGAPLVVLTALPFAGKTGERTAYAVMVAAFLIEVWANTQSININTTTTTFAAIQKVTTLNDVTFSWVIGFLLPLLAALFEFLLIKIIKK